MRTKSLRKEADGGSDAWLSQGLSAMGCPGHPQVEGLGGCEAWAGAVRESWGWSDGRPTGAESFRTGDDSSRCLDSHPLTGGREKPPADARVCVLDFPSSR